MAQKTKWIEGVRAQDPLERAARLALKGRLELVWHYLPRAAEGPPSDVENVHQLRVATRRAMAALEIFASLVPKRRSRWLSKRLQRVRRAAGDARDLDVLADRLARRTEEEPGGERFVRLLHQVRYFRQQAQGPIEKVYHKLRKKGYPRRVSVLVKRIGLRDEADKQCQPTYADGAGHALRPVVEEFFLAGEANFDDYAALHAFRILGKRLRYVMEIFAAAYEPWFRKDLYRQLETLQEKLGEVNDHATAAQHLEAWLADAVDPELCASLGALIAEEKNSLQQTRERFLDWWTADHRDELRRGFARALCGDQCAIPMPPHDANSPRPLATRSE